MTAASVLTSIGLIRLLYLAFDYLSWFFVIVYLLPLFTVGLHRVVKGSERPPIGRAAPSRT